MGYIILGIIILLLLTVFMNDLYRNYRNGDEDKNNNSYRGQLYHNEFSDDFTVNDDLDDVISDEDEDDHNNAMWTNIGMGGSVLPGQMNPNIVNTEFAEDFDDFDDDDVEELDEDEKEESLR